MTGEPQEASGPRCNLLRPWIHAEAKCSGCQASPICGYRYKSLARPAHDLCSKCFLKESSAAQQQFFRIDRCQASKPYQIYYIECDSCGVAPIAGLRYKHKTHPNTDLCEVCYKNVASSDHTAESDFEKMEETKTRSKGNLYLPALHFDKNCDQCKSYPVVGHCYTSIQNAFYDLCAYCHDKALMDGKFQEGDFLVSSHRASIHLQVTCCFNCRAFPIYGPSYKHQRKENKSACLLCYFQIKKEKKRNYTRVEPPQAMNVLRESAPNVVPTIGPVRRSISAPHATHNPSAFVPSPTFPSQHIGQRGLEFSTRGAVQPPLRRPPVSATPVRQPPTVPGVPLNVVPNNNRINMNPPQGSQSQQLLNTATVAAVETVTGAVLASVLGVPWVPGGRGLGAGRGRGGRANYAPGFAPSYAPPAYQGGNNVAGAGHMPVQAPGANGDYSGDNGNVDWSSVQGDGGAYDMSSLSGGGSGFDFSAFSGGGVDPSMFDCSQY